MKLPLIVLAQPFTYIMIVHVEMFILLSWKIRDITFQSYSFKFIQFHMVTMSVGDVISDIISIIPKLGIILGGIAFIIVMWFLGTSLEPYYPGAGASAGGVMAFIAIVIILYICLKYGQDWA